MIVTVLCWSLGVPLGLFLLDRLLLELEERGWIYYRRRQASGTGAGNALSELNAILSPSTREVIVAKEEHRKEQRDEDGQPPDDPLEGAN